MGSQFGPFGDPTAHKTRAQALAASKSCTSSPAPAPTIPRREYSAVIRGVLERHWYCSNWYVEYIATVVQKAIVLGSSVAFVLPHCRHRKAQLLCWAWGVPDSKPWVAQRPIINGAPPAAGDHRPTGSQSSEPGHAKLVASIRLGQPPPQTPTPP